VPGRTILIALGCESLVILLFFFPFSFVHSLFLATAIKKKRIRRKKSLFESKQKGINK
jgi:hypothetical protein